jgi:phosphoesterase RecJ-like protein
MNNTVVIDRITGLISDSRSILVCGHSDPDGDSLGTALAFRRYLLSLGKDVTVVRSGEIPYKYSFMPDIENIVIPESVTSRFDLAIYLECSNPSRAGDVSALCAQDAKIINIDHHPDNSGYGDVVWQDVGASSVGEMLFEIFEHVGYRPDEKGAIQLYAAILTDTGRFRFNSTTRRTMETAGRLIEYGANPRTICDKIYYSLKPSTLKLTGLLLHDMEYYEGERICLMFLTNDKLKKSGAGKDEIEGLVDFVLYGENTQLGGLLKEKNAGLTKISLRSRGNYDVSALAHKYNGGGHVNASGCEIRLPIKDATRQLLGDLKEMLK